MLTGLNVRIHLGQYALKFARLFLDSHKSDAASVSLASAFIYTLPAPPPWGPHARFASAHPRKG